MASAQAFFRMPKRANQLRRLDVFADIEMDQGPGGLRAPVAVMRNMNWAHRVRFDTMTFRWREGGCLCTHDENLGGPK